MVTKDYFSLHGEKIAVTTITMANMQIAACEAGI
jgi:hypothetical protein